MISSAAAIPLLVLLIGAAGLFAGMGADILIWALITVTCYAGLACRRAARRPHRRRRHRRCRRRGATSWSRISSAGSAGPISPRSAATPARSTSSPVIKAVVLLLAIAATALIASSLRGALIVTFALPVAVYADHRRQALDDRRGDHGRPADRCRCRSSPMSPAHLNKSSLMLLSFRSREGRADRRARNRQVDVGRGAPPRRGGQPRQVALSRLDEPRAAHAAQRHPRLLGGDGQRGARADGQPDLSRICPRHPRFRPASARPDQRDPRPVAHRGRPLPAQRGAGDAAARRRGLLPPDGAQGAQQGHPHRPGFRERACRGSSPTSARCGRSRSTFCPTP